MSEDFARMLIIFHAEQVALLREIRDLLKPPSEDVLEEELAGCQHPDDKRVDLSTPNDRGHWICAVCRFDNKITMAQ